MQEFDFLQPQTLDELTAVLDETGGRIVAGGTDIIPKMRHNLFHASTLVDARKVSELSFIEEVDGEVIIGALTTHYELMSSALLRDANPALSAAAANVGCNQTRQRGTLGGNIANASPAADTVPALLVFDAQVRLLCKDAERTLALGKFFVGPGNTQLAPSEMIHSISFSRLSGAWGAAFQKMGVRSGMAIAVVNAAAALVLDRSGAISQARLAFGSVAPTAVRSPKAESVLVGQQPTPGVIQAAAQASAGDISPISDVRSTAAYRQHAAIVLAERALGRAAALAKGRCA